MTHEEFFALLPAYLKGSLSQSEKASMDDHRNHCADCQFLLTIRQDCQELDEGCEVPALFSSSWRQAIHQQGEDSMQNKQEFGRERGPFRVRPWMAVAAALVFVVGGTLLTRRPKAINTQYQYGQVGAPYPGETSAKNESDAISGAGAIMPAAYSRSSADEAAPAPSVDDAKTASKIIRTITLTMVSREFDKDLEALNAALKSVGGHVEYSDIAADRGSRRYANLTLRVPKEKLDAFVISAKALGRTLSMTESQEDISEQYQDVDMRLATQKSKMARLQDLLLKAMTVTDVLDIEREIADTQYQIDSLTGSLRGMDSKVDYSTVTVSISEESVAATAPDQSLFDRIGVAIADAWHQVKVFLADVVVFLSVILPYAVALFILIVIIKKIIWRKKK
jgi:hypothetical protein